MLSCLKGLFKNGIKTYFYVDRFIYYEQYQLNGDVLNPNNDSGLNEEQYQFLCENGYMREVKQHKVYPTHKYSPYNLVFEYREVTITFKGLWAQSVGQRE